MDLVVARAQGLYCPPGDFFIDPWKPVERAVITHGHGDHAHRGNSHYLAAEAGAGILRQRLGADIGLTTLRYGETITHHGVGLSLHPAGHVLGSAQVRLEYGGETWVVSGDYKVEHDATCTPFEPVRCHAFVTESTFGLPIYRWEPQAGIFAGINQWWQDNARQRRASVLFCYSFGKAQRLLYGLDPTIGPILVHGAVEPLNRVYRDAGVQLPATQYVGALADNADINQGIVLAPPSVQGSSWMKRFGDYSDAFASGWMLLRGTRRRRGVDRGFVMSDHADWPGLQSAILATGAERVFVTHGQVDTMVRWLCEQGLDAQAFSTEYGDEEAHEEAQQGAGEAAAEDTPASAVAARAHDGGANGMGSTGGP